MTHRTLAAAVVHRGILACLAVFIGGSPPSRADAATPAEVEAALGKAKKFLYSQQKKEGHWEAGDRMAMHGSGRAWGGHTAIATYALLVAGESPQDPRLKKAIDFLLKEDIELMYALGLRGQIWHLLPKSKITRKAAERDRDLLLQAVNTRQNDEGWGLYHYGLKQGGGHYHNSTAQYGVLGVWGAALAGAEVPNDYWKLIDAAWKRNQDKSGGWTYNPRVDASNPPRASMTTAGVATLFITQDYLFAGEGIKCNGNINNPHIDAGMKWIADHYGQVNGDLYTMYGVERIGVASGHKYFGTVDWYATGADWLVKNQRKDGSWESHGVVPGTSFGIVFLTRGRAPVMFNKLDYSSVAGNIKELSKDKENAAKQKKQQVDKNRKEARWNQRPRDAANVVSWTGEALERALNWQIVNLNVKSADELHDAPILYITGDQPLDFGDEAVAKLRQFCEQGGVILGNADCAKTPFATSFVKLGAAMFPRYEFRQLPNDHIIYMKQLFPMKNRRVNVMALSNGTRELMLLVPREDVARSWQTRAYAQKLEAFQFAANVFLYAVDKKNLRYKGETYLVADKGNKPERTIRLVRLGGVPNHDPEPAGWRRLATILKNDDKIGLEVVEAKPGEGKLAGAKVAHLTGTADFTLTDAARKELAGFVKSGRTLIVDAAGGNTAFADAAERELSATFEEVSKNGFVAIPADHALYTSGLTAVKDVSYRNFAREILKGQTAARIKAIDVGGARLGVFYSREDLSTGLVGQPVDGIYGYEPATATRLMRAMLIYALHDGKLPAAPTTAPATAAK